MSINELSTILSTGSDAIGKDDMECIVYRLIQLREILSTSEYNYLMMVLAKPELEKLDIIHEFFAGKDVDEVDTAVL